MARSKRGALGHAIRAARLRKQTELQNTENETPAVARGTTQNVEAGPRAEQTHAGRHPHASRGHTHGHGTSK